MSYADAHIFLRVGVQVEHDSAAGFGENRAAEPADIAFLDDTVLNFTGPDVLELVDTYAGEVLVQGIGAAAAVRQVVIGDQEGGLIHAIDVAVLGEFGSQLSAWDASEMQCCRQYVGKVEQTIRSVRLCMNVNVRGRSYKIASLASLFLRR